MYVDFHSHILPNADHGFQEKKAALAELKRAHDAGVDTIVVTPHFYLDKDNIADFLERREKAYNELIGEDLFGIKLVKGAEVAIRTGIEELEGLERLCIEGTNYILLEFPAEPWPYWFVDSVKKIQRDRRLRPIIAHVNRYSSVSRQKIFSLNVDVQINAEAFHEKLRHKKEYKNRIEEGVIHLLGSDAHDDGENYYAQYAKAAKKIGKLMPYLTENARRILNTERQR